MYTKEIKLKDSEIPATIDVETGEVREVKHRPNNIPEGQERFAYDEAWSKSYQKSWLFLVNNLSKTELKIATIMSTMTEFATNSLAPLDDNVSYEMLADKFGISKGSVKKAFKNLLKIGVYATFTYGHYRRGIVTEWVFNPFVSFKGKLINSDLKNLFINTPVGQHFLS